MLDMTEIAPFDPTKKKKKKKVITFEEVAEMSNLLENLADIIDECRNDSLQEQVLHSEESNNDEDYSYDFLLERIFDVVGFEDKIAMTLPVPKVLLGTKRTVLVNFLDFCEIMHRQPDHLSKYLAAELGSKNASLDGKDQLVIQGRFRVENIESLLRKYAREYVLCRGCKSFNTYLYKEKNRLTFIRCECGSERSVDPIKQGLQGCYSTQSKR